LIISVEEHTFFIKMMMKAIKQARLTKGGMSECSSKRGEFQRHYSVIELEDGRLKCLICGKLGNPGLK